MSDRKSKITDHKKCLIGQRGQSLVEFAFVLPILLVVLFGILEFGFIITDQIAVANAARDGARTGSLSSSNSAAATQEAQQSATGLISCPIQTPAVTYTSSSPQQVNVTVQCRYSPITPLGFLVADLFHGSLNTNLTLTASTVMQVEQ